MRTHTRTNVARAILVAIPACLGGAACSSAFSAGGAGTDGGPAADGGDGSIIVVTRDGALDDATMGDDAEDDGGSDAGKDARGDGGDHEKSDGSGGDDGGPADEGGREGGGHEAGACGSGYLACDGGCVADDLENCGTCGHDCADLPHVSGPVTCTGGGACSFPESSCAPGWLHCTSNPDDGCETSSTTTSNCGMCGAVCSGGTPVCDGTGCVSGCPKTQPTLCDGGSCVNTGNDPQNCNGCGDVCPAGPTNSTPTCKASTCGYACNAGFSGCSGACVDEQTDPDHCGSCPHVCPAGPPNSTPQCAAAMCGWTCNPGTIGCGGTSCLSQTPDPVAGVFVSSGGPNSSCGDIAAPCGSINAALTVVAQSGGAKTIMYVAESTTPYTEQVTLPAGITVQGGWVYAGAGTWSRPCALDATQVVIAAPAGDDRTVIAAFDGTSTLDTLTVENENTAAPGTATTPGQTLYGIFAANATSGQTSLVLTNVEVDVAAGGAGGTGTQGSGGAAAGSSCTAGKGGNGTTGTLGPGSSAGTYDVNGYHPAMGSIGGTGKPGENGTAAPAKGQTGGPGCVTFNSICCRDPPTTKSCVACTSTPKACATAGTNGCASGASGGGAGGTGGGASLGIFAWNTTVQVSGAVAAIAQGGEGGNGGGGGTVAAPSDGSIGDPSATEVTSCTSSPTSCQQTRTSAPGGNAGGPGGSGGAGGQGGGGSGGDGFCFYAGGTSTPPSTGLSCTTGSAAPGGNAGQADEGAGGQVGTSN